MVKYTGFDKARLEQILAGIQKVKIALVGDVCVDIYWLADMAKSELSRETPHFPLPVVEERFSPGAGGNAAANMAALKPARVSVVSVMGDDWRGKILMDEFANRGIDTSGIVYDKNSLTPAYCKPLRKGISDVVYQDPRLDFENRAAISAQVEDRLIENINALDADIVAVSDQFLYGAVTPRVREALAKTGVLTLVDSRFNIGMFENAVLKPNEVEGCRVAFGEYSPDMSFEHFVKAAETIAAQRNTSVCMTIGQGGCLLAKDGQTTLVSATPAQPPIDIVGAGDCFLSAFSLALAAKADPAEAAWFANLAAGVTVKKLGTTGTASPEEILARFEQVK